MRQQPHRLYPAFCQFLRTQTASRCSELQLLQLQRMGDDHDLRLEDYVRLAEITAAPFRIDG